MNRTNRHGRQTRPGRSIAVALSAALLAASAAPGPAAAQTSVKGVPSERPDQNPSEPRARPRVAAPPTQVRDARAAIAPFTLARVEVQGSTVAGALVTGAYRPFIGRPVDNETLAAITDAVAAAYATSDVALYTVLVPEQSFANGTLRLTVVEGHVAAVEVRGHLRRKRLALLRAYLRRIERERPLRKATLQRVVSLIRDLPGLTTEVGFDRGEEEGAVKLVLQARERPVQIAAGVNDRGTALLGRTQAQADAYLNAVLGGGDQLRATVVLPTGIRPFQYYAGAYTAPLDADGTTITGNLSYLRTRPAAVPLEGDAVSFGAQLSRPLIRTYTRSLYLTVGLDGIDSDNALLGFTLSNDRTRTFRTALSYGTASERNQLTVSATASFGLDVLGARFVPGQSDQHFSKLNLKAGNATQIGKSVALRLNAFVQLTGHDLPSSEQVALGGDEFGRAYEAAIIAGDHGYAGSVELAWRPASGLPKLLAGSELYLFSDAGRVTYRGRAGAADIGSHLASVGIGARLAVAARTVLQIEAVRGLNDPVFYADRTRTRILFSARSLF